MMPVRRIPSLFQCISTGALMLVLAGCTPGGQFDPTTLLANDMFDTKKKLPGEREPVFPSGVPGTATGVPPDLVKGYQPPPDQAATDATATTDTAAPPAEKPKLKPKPKLARAPSQATAGSAQNQKPAQAPTRISVGPKVAAPAQPAANSSQSVWPAPPQRAPAQQSSQSSQSIWPTPPAPTSTSQ
jgi:hypothetical protein